MHIEHKLGKKKKFFSCYNAEIWGLFATIAYLNLFLLKQQEKSAMSAGNATNSATRSPFIPE